MIAGIKNKKDRYSKVIWFIVGSALTVAGFIIIPPLIKKYGDKVYKKSLNTEDIDFDNMGPEIVPFNDDTKEGE
jgi:hypothetical protein